MEPFSSDLKRVRELFEAALDVPPDARESFLEAHCGGDAELLRRVVELLRHEQSSEGFLSAPAASWPSGAELDAESWIGREVGGYRIRSVLARGGMGLVFEAEQASPRRLVALKTLRRRYGSEDSVRRFRLEVEVLGLLKHPGMAQIHGAGTFDDGGEQVPFIAMELVEGARSIVRYATERGLDERARIELFGEVCDAVEYGHRKGIVHRDLKPGNVLVNEAGAVKVIDFGLARVADPDAVRVSLVETLHGGLLGTLEYMSPEHVSGTPLDVDVRSDVFSLGCILYELLCGRPPRDFAGLPIPAAVQRLQSEEPEIPADLPRELRWILVKALERSPERRYASARALAEDLARYLRHESVDAVQPTALYQLSKFGRRHRAFLAAIAAVLVALTVGLVQARNEARRARDAEEYARVQWTVAAGVGRFLGDMFAESHAYRRGADAKVSELIKDAVERLHNVKDPAAHAVLSSYVAEGLLNTDQRDAAIELLEPAWEWMRENVPPGDVRRVHAGALWVDLLEQRGDYDRSLVETRELLDEARSSTEVNPYDVHYLETNLIVLYQRLGRFADAEELVREQLTQLIDVPGEEAGAVDSLHRLGALVMEQGRTSEARELFERGLELARAHDHVSPAYDTVLSMAIGSIHANAGDLDLAEQYMREAMEGFDSGPALASNRISVRLNLLDIFIKRIHRSEPYDTQEVLRLRDETEDLVTEYEPNPGRFHLSIWLLSSRLARLTGDTDRAVELARRVLELSDEQFPGVNPHAPGAYEVLAQAYEEAGDLDRSLATLERGLEVMVEDHGEGSSPWRALARSRVGAHERSGNTDEALVLARELLDRTPDGADDLERNRQLVESLGGAE